MNQKGVKKGCKKKIISILVILLLCFRAIGFLNYQKSMSEVVIRKYMSESLGQLNDEEVKMLSQNLSEEIDEKLEGLDIKELSESNLEELLAAVNTELAHATYNIPPDELNDIANEIVKKVLKDQNYQKAIDELTTEVEYLAETSYSEADIRKVASELDLSEEDIAQIMQNAGITDKALQSLASEMDMSVEELTKMIADNREYTDALYIELGAILDFDPAELKQLMENAQNSYARYSFLSQKLGVTEEKLCAEIAKCKELSNAEVKSIAEQLNLSTTDFQTKLDNNMQITEKQLKSIEEQVEVDLSELEKLIGDNKATLDQSIQELEGKVEKSKEDLETSIDEVNSSLTTKADAEDVADIEDKIDSLEADISGKAEIHYSNNAGKPTLEISAVVQE